jgi:broad specificity phosphatase PhoE
MKVTFLRHGESEYNVKGILNNDPKNKNVSPLTEKGVKQAEKAAEKLKDKKFDIIFCSGFIRARQTAEIVNRFHKNKIIIDKRINEVHVGFEDKKNEEFVKALENSKDKFAFKLKGKESWNDLKKRVQKFLDWLKDQKYESVLIVSHQWVIGAANQLIKNLSDEEAQKELTDTAEFIELELI